MKYKRQFGQQKYRNIVNYKKFVFGDLV